jgi:hypothetical protein
MVYYRELTQEVACTGQMPSMLCWKSEVELYVKTLTSSRTGGRVSRNCNQNLWAPGCQPGWACSTEEYESLDGSEVPSRALNCRPCCPGFFCPRGLTCMMRKSLSLSLKELPQHTELILYQNQEYYVPLVFPLNTVIVPAKKKEYSHC